MADNNVWGNVTLAMIQNNPQQWEFYQSVINNPMEERIVEGCAGSGKTLMAAFAVSALVGKNMKSGLMVYTNVLERFIGDNFPKDSGLKNSICHYDQWINAPVEQDVYIVDEAQDFPKKRMDSIKSHSKTQIWLGDEQQEIYKHASNAFNEMKVSLRSSQKTKFEINYRNTQKIALFASNFITLTKSELDSGISIEKKRKDLLQSISKQGDFVSLVRAENVELEFDFIANEIKKIQNDPTKGSKTIAVAHFIHNLTTGPNYPYRAEIDNIEKQLLKRGISSFRKEKIYSENKLPENYFNDSNLVLITPIHSLKGLEVDYVFFPMSDYLYDDFPFIDKRDNLLYVLFTRARQKVYVSYVDENKSYIWNKIKNQSDLNSYCVKIKASDFLTGKTAGSETNIDDVF